MASVRVYVKKQLRLDLLSFNQRRMYQLGNAGLASVTHRVRYGKDANDATAPPLNKRYAITKSKKLGKAAKRDLHFTGSMLGNLKVRTVAENRASASLSSRKERAKGRVHATFFQRRTGSSWLAYSATNVTETFKAAAEIFRETVSHLIKERAA